MSGVSRKMRHKLFDECEKLRETILTLTTKLEAAERRSEYWKAEHLAGNSVIAEQSAQIEALEKDAARYRWLKENKAHNNTHCWHFQKWPLILGLLTIDAAIDAAILGDSHVR